MKRRDASRKFHEFSMSPSGARVGPSWRRRPAAARVGVGLGARGWKPRPPRPASRSQDRTPTAWLFVEAASGRLACAWVLRGGPPRPRAAATAGQRLGPCWGWARGAGSPAHKDQKPHSGVARRAASGYLPRRSPEGWLSGLRRTTRNRESSHGLRGFKSLPLRHSTRSLRSLAHGRPVH